MEYFRVLRLNIETGQYHSLNLSYKRIVMSSRKFCLFKFPYRDIEVLDTVCRNRQTYSN